MKAVLREKFLALSTYIRKVKSLKSITCFYLKKLLKEEQIKSKLSRKKKELEQRSMKLKKKKVNREDIQIQKLLL